MTGLTGKLWPDKLSHLVRPEMSRLRPELPHHVLRRRHSSDAVTPDNTERASNQK